MPNLGDYIRSLASQAPVTAGVVGGAVGTPFGIGPATGFASAGIGEIINQLLNPSATASKYYPGQKIRPEDLQAFRQEKMGEIGKVLGKGATTSLAMQALQSLLGTRTPTAASSGMPVTNRTYLTKGNLMNGSTKAPPVYLNDLFPGQSKVNNSYSLNQ